MQNVEHGSEILPSEFDAQGNVQTTGLNKKTGTSQSKHAVKPLSFSNSTRWVPHRKAEVVDAVRSGRITLDETCERFAMSIEEFLTWQRGIKLSGLAGLRVSRAQPRKLSKAQSAGDEPLPRHRKAPRAPKET